MKFLSMLPKGQTLLLTKQSHINKIATRPRVTFIATRPRVTFIATRPRVTFIAILAAILYSLIIKPIARQASLERQKMAILTIVLSVLISLAIEETFIALIVKSLEKGTG